MYREEKSYDGKVHLIDVNSPEFIADPYKLYKERREAGGGILQIFEGQYSVSDFELGSQVLRNRSVGRFTESNMDNPEFVDYMNANPVVKIIQNWMIFKNPPVHTRLRQLVARAFTPRRIAELEDTMREIVSDLLNSFQAKSSGNFITDFAYPFPVTLISHMMGIPSEDIHLFRKWSQDFAMALATDVGSLPDHLQNRLNNSAIALTKYFENLLEKKKDRIKEGLAMDLLETLLVAQEDGDSLSTAELLSNATLLLVAGHETTTNLLGNGLHALLKHPDQLEMMQSDSNLISNAVEEFLRYDAPVQSIGRGALEDVEINGMQFEKGNWINVSLGATNRDPKVNQNPDMLDIIRKDPKHLSFAAGIHYCLGAPLARLEAKVAFEEIFDRFSSIQLEREATRSPNWLLRGFADIPIQVSR